MHRWINTVESALIQSQSRDTENSVQYNYVICIKDASYAVHFG